MAKKMLVLLLVLFIIISFSVFRNYDVDSVDLVCIEILNPDSENLEEIFIGPTKVSGDGCIRLTDLEWEYVKQQIRFLKTTICHIDGVFYTITVGEFPGYVGIGNPNPNWFYTTPRDYNGILRGATLPNNQPNAVLWVESDVINEIKK